MKYIILVLLLFSCGKSKINTNANSFVKYSYTKFVMGADLSYINQLEDNNVVYKDNGNTKNAFEILNNHGCNTVRVRLWHNPSWQLTYTSGKLYSNIYDVEKTIFRAKSLGMAVNLDFHYSDTWTDPSSQTCPSAWVGLPLNILKDSVYNYTLATLNYLKSKNLVPEMIQIGNEINSGMLWDNGKVVNNDFSNIATLLNCGIKAVRDFSLTSSIKPEIILHVAQIQNSSYWVSKLLQNGVLDFDIIGISHYFLWSTVNDMNDISSNIASLKKYFF